MDTRKHSWTRSNKSIEAEASTYARYTRIIERFLEFLATKAARDVSTLQAVDITRFRDREAKALSRATANLSLKVLRVCLSEAVRQGLLAVNTAVRVPVLKSVQDQTKRRAFTLAESSASLKRAATIPNGAALSCLDCTLGQRLSDLAKLSWRAVNLESGEIAFTTRKTSRRIDLRCFSR